MTKDYRTRFEGLLKLSPKNLKSIEEIGATQHLWIKTPLSEDATLAWLRYGLSDYERMIVTDSEEAPSNDYVEAFQTFKKEGDEYYYSNRLNYNIDQNKGLPLPYDMYFFLKCGTINKPLERMLFDKDTISKHYNALFDLLTILEENYYNLYLIVYGKEWESIPKTYRALLNECKESLESICQKLDKTIESLERQTIQGKQAVAYIFETQKKSLERQCKELSERLCDLDKMESDEIEKEKLYVRMLALIEKKRKPTCCQSFGLTTDKKARAFIAKYEGKLLSISASIELLPYPEAEKIDSQIRQLHESAKKLALPYREEADRTQDAKEKKYLLQEAEQKEDISEAIGEIYRKENVIPCDRGYIRNVSSNYKIKENEQYPSSIDIFIDKEAKLTITKDTALMLFGKDRFKAIPAYKALLFNIFSKIGYAKWESHDPLTGAIALTEDFIFNLATGLNLEESAKATGNNDSFRQQKSRALDDFRAFLKAFKFISIEMIKTGNTAVILSDISSPDKPEYIEETIINNYGEEEKKTRKVYAYVKPSDSLIALSIFDGLSYEDMPIYVASLPYEQLSFFISMTLSNHNSNRKEKISRKLETLLDYVPINRTGHITKDREKLAKILQGLESIGLISYDSSKFRKANYPDFLEISFPYLDKKKPKPKSKRLPNSKRKEL